MTHDSFYDIECPGLPSNQRLGGEFRNHGNSLSVDLVDSAKQTPWVWNQIGRPFSHFNAETSTLRHVKFKLGYPYLIRHSALQRTTSGSHTETGCCDHIFMFSDLRLASWPHDRALLNPESCVLSPKPGIIETFHGYHRREVCEICQTANAFAVAVYSAPHTCATYTCKDCFEMVVKASPHKLYPYTTRPK